MNRNFEVEMLYKELTTLVRRSRELSSDLHPGLSLVAYTFLSQIQLQPGIRAADLADLFGLDKSTVSRQVDQLAASDLLVRRGERPGQRGQILELTAAGEAALAAAGSRHSTDVHARRSRANDPCACSGLDRPTGDLNVE
jgi:DNA-binding MarR family transcriptional regulator